MDIHIHGKPDQMTV